VLHRLLPILVLLAGCYGKPELPDVPPSAAAPATVDATVPRATPMPQPGAQARRTEQLAAVLARLAEPDARPAPQRDGAATWRPAELEKLHELLVEACTAGAGPCVAATRQVAAAALPADEIWPLAGRFLGPARPHAEAALPPLIERFLGAPDSEDRDRAYRLLVGAGVVHRGQLSATGHAAATLPARPVAGEPAWLIVERIAPCDSARASFKGPDPRGRIDAVIEPDCPPAQAQDEGEAVLIPRVHRYVATLRLPAFPASGLQIFEPNAPDPVLVARAIGAEAKPADGGFE
jgi:hypothetical protein